MRIAIISDIHGNLVALKAVKKDIDKLGIDMVYCLGDIVGYGSNPNECLEIVREICRAVITGNHERLARDPKGEQEKVEDISPLAIAGIEYTLSVLNDDNRQFIGALPVRCVDEELSLSIAHGSFALSDPWIYTDTEDAVQAEIGKIETRLVALGHSHVPFVFGSKVGHYKTLPTDMLLRDYQKYLINVGSVGQPRDGDCRACYGVLEFCDDGRILYNLRRVFYQIPEAEEAFRKTKLPPWLAERLYMGE